jgi:thiol peroxidase
MIFSVKEDKMSFQGMPVKLKGKFQEVGNKAPSIKVITPDLQEKLLGYESNKAQLIITVPSLDTTTCATEARVFNEKLSQHENLDVTIVSMDLPFAAATFCNTSNIKNLTIGSDFRNKEFARSYGILIDDGILKGLCARAIFVISKDAKIVYKQIVPEITDEPDYEKALEAAHKAANAGASCCGFCQ